MADDRLDPASPDDGEPVGGPPPAGVAAPTDALRRYIAQQGGTFTDEALTAKLLAAGHPEADVRSALAEHRAEQGAGPTRKRAIRVIVIAYVGIYALLSIGMLANGRPPGHLMPDAGGGIVILTGTLIAAFVASMLWVASRWAFGILFFGLLTLATIGGATSSFAYPGYWSPIVFVPPAIGILGLIWLLRRGRPAGRGMVALEVLLAIPIVLLVGVAGACLATGLPIPGGA